MLVLLIWLCFLLVKFSVKSTTMLWLLLFSAIIVALLFVFRSNANTKKRHPDKLKRFYEGKVVWITGASSGIGEGICLGFAIRLIYLLSLTALASELHKLGAKLILSGRRVDELNRVQNEVGGDTKVLQVDQNDLDR